jgi:hypothetical protein
MSANQVLLWMSAKQSGSWQQFRSAIEWLHAQEDQESDARQAPENQEFPLHQQLRFNLQRLGHAEFFAVDQSMKWRVAPPVLATTRRRDGWVGVVVGARSRALLERLHASSTAFDVEPQSACPDVLLLRTQDAGALGAAAAQAGLIVQQNAPEALLACLPPIDAKHLSAAAAVPLGTGWKIERFCTDGLRWVPATRSDVTSASHQLFRFEYRYQKHHLFCTAGLAMKVAPQVGKFLAMKRRRRQVTKYDAQHERLTLPATCRPPLLIERALTLCSGRPPRYEVIDGRGSVHYDDVPPPIALTAALLMRQEVRP